MGQGIALLTALALTTTPYTGTVVAENKTNSNHQKIDPSVPIGQTCSDPDKARKLCLVAPQLYRSAVIWEKRANYLKIENEKLSKQLTAAEKALTNSKNIPEPEGLNIPTWAMISGTLLVVGLSIGGTLMISNRL